MNTFSKKVVIGAFALTLLFTVGYANVKIESDGHSNVQIKHGTVEGTPKDSSIQATINGHVLSVVFLENLGQVDIDLTTDTGDPVDATSIYTPNGVNFIITYPNRYIVTFTLENGDMYYGEFEVTD